MNPERAGEPSVVATEEAATIVAGRPPALLLGATPASILALQRAAGNRAVVRSLNRRVLARYEAGEHMQLGNTGDAMRSIVEEDTLTYEVEKNDSIESIARKFSVTPEELMKLNAGKVKDFRVKGAKKTVKGFLAGEEIKIPNDLNPAVVAALTANELSFKIAGTTLTYGAGIALAGDMFGTPDEMTRSTKDKLDKLSALAKSEIGAKTVAVSVYQEATGGRFLELAQDNESHFAPSDAKFAPVSGLSKSDHKQTWEKYHAEAINASQAGDVDKALHLNSFADHFLTDAFASGHLINKRDVMEKFKKTLPTNAKGKFTQDAVKFFDAVANEAFIGDVAKEFSKYETVTWEGYVFRPNIDSASRFSALLQGVHKERPDLVANAIARAVHTTLNNEPGGVPVINGRNEKWNLSGDETLNEDTKRIARRAVAQSQLNVLSMYKRSTPPDLVGMYGRVWVYTPRPTPDGEAIIKKRVGSGTDPTDPTLISVVAALIKDNYKEIIKQLVALNKLKKA